MSKPSRARRMAGCQRLRQRELAVARLHQRKARRLAGNAGRQRGVGGQCRAPDCRPRRGTCRAWPCSGATSRASITTLRPSLARCSRYMPPPRKPEPLGSTTISAALTATAASKALPPCAQHFVAGFGGQRMRAGNGGRAGRAIGGQRARTQRAQHGDSSSEQHAATRRQRLHDARFFLRSSAATSGSTNSLTHCRRRSRSRGSASRR